MTHILWQMNVFPLQSLTFRFGNDHHSPPLPNTYRREPDRNKSVLQKKAIQKMCFSVRRNAISTRLGQIKMFAGNGLELIDVTCNSLFKGNAVETIELGSWEHIVAVRVDTAETDEVYMLQFLLYQAD